jgi:ECF transporter S component (folate family)
MNKKSFYKIKQLVTLSMLVALEIVLNRFLSINTIGTKIGFSFVPIVVAAVLFGPLYAGVAYALSDFLGAILFPIGPYFPGFTVCAFLMGFTYGIFLYKKQRHSLIKNVLLPVLLNNVVFGLLINTIWVSILYGSKSYFGWFIYRLPEYAILIPVSFVIIPFIIKICEILKRSFYS